MSSVVAACPALMNRVAARTGVCSRRGPTAAVVRCAAQQHNKPQAVLSAESLALSVMSTFQACAPAGAEELVDFGKGGNADPKSYFTVLALFLLSLPGLWSQVKRAPKAKIKRKTFETPGPEASDGMAMDSRAKQLYSYMKSYNYEVKSTGEVITFEGNYRSTRGQAAAITFYMFVGMLCTGLVLSIAAPGGALWYSLVLLTPAAPWYYYKNADRKEEFSIKMIASDDDKTIDVVVQGDEEEITRMTNALEFKEKGMVYVPGVLEKQA